MAYYTYILRCADRSLYAGIATDLSRRMKEHFEGGTLCARYTKTHRPVALCAAWESVDRSAASRLEARIKRLSKAQKEDLVFGIPVQEIFGESFGDAYRPLSEEELKLHSAEAKEFLG